MEHSTDGRIMAKIGSKQLFQQDTVLQLWILRCMKISYSRFRLTRRLVSMPHDSEATMRYHDHKYMATI